MKIKNILTKFLHVLGTIIMIGGGLMVIITYLNHHNSFVKKDINIITDYLVPLVVVLVGFLITKIVKHFDKTNQS